MSVAPVVFMLAALAGLIMFVGSNAIADYSHLILLVATILAIGLSIASRTFRFDKLKDGMLRSARQILPAIPLLLLIAMISATWLLSGVVPTLIDYGIRVLNPTMFLVATCLICATVSVLTGSSWTTIATIGVAFIGIGRIMGYNEGWIAGAIISGAYFGDKVSPLSDTTVIASSSCGVDLFDHIRYLMLTALPALMIALGVFACVGLLSDAAACDASSTAILHALHSQFNITPWTLVIPCTVMVMIAFRIRTIYTLAWGTVLGIAGIFIFQPGILAAATGMPIVTVADGIMAVARALWTDTGLATGNEMLDDLVVTGGVTGMLPTITLVMCAMLFGGVMLGTGMLAVMARAFTSRLKRRTSIVGATVGSGLFLNACTADQYLSIIIGGNMYRDVYKRYSLEPRLLSRTLEDSVSVTSVLIPWNSCGVTQSTVLGVATLAYLPYCIFNIMSPLMSLLMAWTGFKIPSSRLHTSMTTAN